MATVYPSDEYLAGVPEWDGRYSTVLERDYEDDYPEDLYSDEDYYPGYGDYVAPEMDCN